MLIRAGMSVKHALFYNCVSSVLCLIGMVIGVCAGNVGDVSLWIFALAAGMFIYIALVDMVRTIVSNLFLSNHVIHLVTDPSDPLKTF